VRYEMTVRTQIAFFDPTERLDEKSDPIQAIIHFEGMDFVWHPNLDRESHDAPTVTVMVADQRGDYLPEAIAMEQLLSAMTYLYNHPIESLYGGASSFAGPLDRAVIRAGAGTPGGAVGVLACNPPGEVVVVSDDRLRLVLALYREGLAAESPFYRFLALWNALDAAFDGDEDQRDGFIRGSPTRAPGWFGHYENPPPDWVSYLQDSNRNAVAHAIRRSPTLPVLNPDAPRDRGRLVQDNRLMKDLVRDRVEERWPYAVFSRPRATAS